MPSDNASTITLFSGGNKAISANLIIMDNNYLISL